MHEIETWRVALAAAFVLAAGASSVALRLRLHGSLVVGAARTVAQLGLLGLLLRPILSWDHPLPVLGVFSLMILFAAVTVRGRLGRKSVPTFLPVLAVMFVSYMAVAVFMNAAVVASDPWWTPRIFIPLMGMLVGNSLNAVALGLERLLSELRARRAEVEAALALGASRSEASAGMLGDAVRAGMIPSINSMAAAGVVFIPGVMTGQIMAGADPLAAVKYQIAIMLMLVGSTAVSTVGVLFWVRRLCFTPGHALRRL